MFHHNDHVALSAGGLAPTSASKVLVHSWNRSEMMTTTKAHAVKKLTCAPMRAAGFDQ